MKCEKCGNDHDGAFGSGRFCSRRCACSKVFSKEAIDKKSKAAKQYLKDHPEARKNLTGGQKVSGQELSAIHIARFAKRTFDECGWDSKRKRIIAEQDNKCLSCGLSEWLGNPIVLEVDHINGDNTDDSRTNLRALCPNCHASTTTWKGRNKTSFKTVSDEEFKALLLSEPNIRQAILKAGMNPNSATHYVRAKKLLS